MKMRSIKRTPLGTYSRDTVRTAVRGVHVLETAPGGEWEVRTLGEKGSTTRFAAKAKALEYAFQVKRNDSKVFVHQRQPRKVTVARMRKAGSGLAIRETELQ